MALSKHFRSPPERRGKHTTARAATTSHTIQAGEAATKTAKPHGAHQTSATIANNPQAQEASNHLEHWHIHPPEKAKALTILPLL